MSLRISDPLSKAVFGSLLGVIAIATVPYGGFEPWWKAAFICGVFAICVIAIADVAVSGQFWVGRGAALLPMLALAALAFVQAWAGISADPFQTRFVVLQLLALTAFLGLLYRYAASERRVRIIVYLILGVAVASAIFGILRQSTQQQDAFLLPLLKQNQGFAQFINKNHFAYLMEMAFGVGLGMLINGGDRRGRLLARAAVLLPIWMALVLSNSRGGILAMLSQVVIAALLLMSVPSEGFKASRWAALRVTLVAVLIAGVVFGIVWVGGDRLLSNFEAASSDLGANVADMRDGASRNEIWRATFKMFAAHPTLGVGLGGYWIGITAYHDASGALTPQEAHNDYLELVASGGLIGLAIGVWFAVNVIRLARKQLESSAGFIRAARIGALIGIAGVAAHSFFDFGLHLMGNAAVFLTLIMIATGKIEAMDHR